VCGGLFCARFLGYYYRQVVDEEGIYYPDFPVARFVCRRKGDAPVTSHRTFSLLHYHLVPYWKYSILFIIQVLESKHMRRLSLKLLLDYLADLETQGDGYINLCNSRIFEFKGLIGEVIAKLLISDYYPELTSRLQPSRDAGDGSVKIFLDYCREFECCKVTPPIRGPCGLSVDFYLRGGSYRRNSYFLFGTPSQFRGR
jgi:hypothetical protein